MSLVTETSLYPPSSIHPTAVVDEGARVGAGCRIWHFAHLMPNCTLGEGCSIGQGVFVAAGVQLGRNVKVQNNVSIYEGVTCEDDVFLGPSCVFTNVRNPRSAVVRRGQYSPTLVRRGATIGANATIVCGLTIGEYAFIGAGAVVTHDVPAYALMLGTPARPVGWMSRYGHRLAFDPATGRARCPESGDDYVLTSTGEVRFVEPAPDESL
jgi:UDP-2-acetamido-3-amino-2,3-dideoxy-glucuronate N-acetyltransferase